jgi:LysM repeat protein
VSNDRKGQKNGETHFNLMLSFGCTLLGSEINRKPRLRILVGLLLVWIAAGCAAQPAPAAVPTLLPSATASATLRPSATVTRTPIPATVTPSPTPTLAMPVFYDPAGCKRPPDEYGKVKVNGWTINQRTLAMLQYAQELYGGELDIANQSITQGSYHDNGAASFGTHLGGGAVDLSVMRLGTFTVLRQDTEPLVRALRVAGFAAWLRELEELFPGSPIHIHAIAVGDKELSQPAKDQLTGKFGYFLGYTAVPQTDGIPKPDRHGGPVLCRWMVEMGYQDMRPAAERDALPEPDAKILSLASGSLVQVRVGPGDTLPEIAARMNSTVAAIAAQNQLQRLDVLTLGQTLVVPANLK